MLPNRFIRRSWDRFIKFHEMLRWLKAIYRYMRWSVNRIKTKFRWEIMRSSTTYHCTTILRRKSFIMNYTVNRSYKAWSME